tara:strand:+ start:5210 stop:5533 length:324 start_codon:yes stop_codon:yes gene_type:complete
VGAVAAEGGGFVLLKEVGFGGAVGVGEDVVLGCGVAEGDGVFGGILKAAGGAGEFFAGFSEALIDGFALEKTVRSAIGTIDLYLWHVFYVYSVRVLSKQEMRCRSRN